MKNIWKNYNLSVVLACLFLLSWLAQYIFQWQEFVSNQQAHDQAITFAEFLPQFLASTFENWQSEFLQLLSMAILTSFLVHKGSAESRDSDDKMQATLADIQKQLKAMKK
jgi:hypothetical protein